MTESDEEKIAPSNEPYQFFKSNHRAPSRALLNFSSNSISQVKSISAELNSIKTLANSYQISILKEKEHVQALSDNSKLFQQVTKSS